MLQAEKCGLCGKAIEFDDPDLLEFHGGRGGLVHASCLQESAEAVIDAEREEMRGA